MASSELSLRCESDAFMVNLLVRVVAVKRDGCGVSSRDASQQRLVHSVLGGCC